MGDVARSTRPILVQDLYGKRYVDFEENFSLVSLRRMSGNLYIIHYTNFSHYFVLSNIMIDQVIKIYFLDYFGLILSLAKISNLDEVRYY